MTDILLPKNGWVLVCDGARALILKNEGDTSKVDLRSVEVFSEPHAPARDLGDDRPGRSVQSVGSARSAMDDTDWHERAEAEFLKKIVAELGDAIRNQDVPKLVVVAPPKALGMLRDLFPAPIKAKITAEVAKDLTKVPVAEIAGHLFG